MFWSFGDPIAITINNKKKLNEINQINAVSLWVSLSNDYLSVKFVCKSKGPPCIIESALQFFA